MSRRMLENVKEDVREMPGMLENTTREMREIVVETTVLLTTAPRCMFFF